jgi:AbrB family looped-hinge helix DNA binding protein
MRVPAKGQVTIPVAIRRQVGLDPDFEVEFEIVDGAVLIRPAPGSRAVRARRVVDRLRNASYTRNLTTNDIMRLTRGGRLAERVTLVDSSVLIDILTHDPTWEGWSTAAIEEALNAGSLAINPIIYAEVAVGFPTFEDAESAMPLDQYARLPLPWPAAFAARRAFAEYRMRGGLRAATLADFYVGAQPTILGLTLLTRDLRGVRTYFPTVHIVSPP